MSTMFTPIALSCCLGLGTLERRGRAQRPWLTLIRADSEANHLFSMRHYLRTLAPEASSRDALDWIPGERGEDIARLRFHSPALEPLLDMTPAQRWEACGPHSLRALWYDRGLWKARGRGGEIRVRRCDDPKEALKALHRYGTKHARLTPGPSRGPHRVIAVDEIGMQELVCALRPFFPGWMRRYLVRRDPIPRYGLMGLGKALNAGNAYGWEKKIGFLP